MMMRLLLVSQAVARQDLKNQDGIAVDEIMQQEALEDETSSEDDKQ